MANGMRTVLKKCSTCKEISVINPLEFLRILEENK
jgi:hypothetical protein